MGYSYQGTLVSFFVCGPFALKKHNTHNEFIFLFENELRKQICHNQKKQLVVIVSSLPSFSANQN